jgi:putative transposase
VNTTVSFEEQPVFVEDMTQRLDEVHSASLPWLTDDPVQFAWSSCASLCSERDDPLLAFHPAYMRLGSPRAERADAYRSLLGEALSDDELHAIRSYLQQRALRRDEFRTMVEAKTRRFAGIRPAHRPRL